MPITLTVFVKQSLSPRYKTVFLQSIYVIGAAEDTQPSSNHDSGAEDADDELEEESTVEPLPLEESSAEPSPAVPVMVPEVCLKQVYQTSTSISPKMKKKLNLRNNSKCPRKLDKSYGAF